MINYLDLLQEVLDVGEPRHDRTGVGTQALFARRLHFDLTDSFPAMTTKKLYFKGVADELLWFLSGSTNVNDLSYARKWWEPFTYDDGSIGPGYGEQWRWRRTDQIANLITGLQSNPQSRRHVVSAWIPEDLRHMGLPPCHALFQMYVDNADGLHCQMYQRSADIFLGLPMNIASYALLTHIIAMQTHLHPASLTIVLGDVHLYANHRKQAEEQLNREPLPLPTLAPFPWRKLEDYQVADFRLEAYQHHDPIKAEMAV